MRTIELNVQEMSCGACVKHVTQALSPLPGVEAVEVDLQGGRVKISGSADAETLLAALDDAGYPAQLATGKQAGGCCGGCSCH